MFFRSQCLSYISLQIPFFPIQNCAIPIPIPKLLQGLPFNIANASHAHAYSKQHNKCFNIFVTFPLQQLKVSAQGLVPVVRSSGT